MTRPLTLFTGQWADLPFEEVWRLASSWGYDGLEIACSADHLDVERGAVDDAYIAGRRATLDRYGLRGDAISAHLPSGCVRRPDRRAAPRHTRRIGLGRRRSRVGPGPRRGSGQERREKRRPTSGG